MLFSHNGNTGFGQQKAGSQVGVDGVVPGFDRHFFHQQIGVDTGVVTHDVQPAMGASDVFNKRPALILFADVGPEELGASAVTIDRPDHLFTVLNGASCTDDRRAFAGKHPGDALTNAPAGAGDDCNLSLNADAHLRLLRFF